MCKMHEPSDEVSSSPLPIMRPERLCLLPQRNADCMPSFFNTKGPGKGDHATAEFVRSRREVDGCFIGGGILFNKE